MTASPKQRDPLRPVGFLLLMMGWVLVLSAIVLLEQEAARGGFVSPASPLKRLVCSSWCVPISLRNRSGINLNPFRPQTTLCIVSLLIAPLACAGLALINSGLGRARSAAHTMTAAMCVIAVAACVYVICGRSWQGSPGEAGRIFSIHGMPWNWLGEAPPFFAKLPFDGSPAFLTAWMGIIAAGLTGLIPLGTGSERWRLGSICISTAILAGWTFPLFAHWAWGGGWLAQLGYVNVGGSGTIHVVGGLTALSVAWLLGPRKGKFGYDGMPMAIPGHNAVYILFGCLLAATGWTGLNAAGAILFAGVQPGRLALIAVNTILAQAREVWARRPSRAYVSASPIHRSPPMAGSADW